MPPLGTARTLLQQMLDGMAEHICLLDITGKIIAVNAAWLRFGKDNGAEPGGLSVGINYLEVCERAMAGTSCRANAELQRTAGAFCTALRSLLAQHKAADFELDYPCHSPTAQRWFSARARRITGQGPIAVVVEHRDITIAHQAQIALRDSEENYRLLFETSIDGVLHTTPDGSILAANRAACTLLRMSEAEICRRGRQGLVDSTDVRLEAALRQRAAEGSTHAVLTLVRGLVPADGEAAQLLGVVLGAAHRGRDVVQQILAFSRRTEPQPKEPQSVARLLDEVSDLLRPILPAAIRLAAAPCRPDLQVHANAAQIQQVLMNLAINAWHSMKDRGGEIRLSASGQVVGGGHCGAPLSLASGAYVRLAVSDDGCGMTEAALQRIFEPFYTTKSVGEGTGLGLSVAHGIVQEHGGALSVGSTPGVGTTFHVWLPMASGSARAPAERHPEPPLLEAVGGTERIVVVDDDDVMRLVTERVLMRSGYRVSSYSNTRDALQALRIDPGAVDLVLTDYNMPGSSGVELVQAVVSLHPRIPVVVILRLRRRASRTAGAGGGRRAGPEQGTHQRRDAALSQADPRSRGRVRGPTLTASSANIRAPLESDTGPTGPHEIDPVTLPRHH